MVNSGDDEAGENERGGIDGVDNKAKKATSEGNNMERSLSEMLSRRIVGRHRGGCGGSVHEEQKLKLERERHANMGCEHRLSLESSRLPA